MFTLAGQTPQQAASSAQTVLMVETLLAANSMDRTKRRDPKNRDHKMTREEVVALAPDFYLNRYFAAVGAPNFTAMNVTNPDFFKQVNGVIAALPLDSLKTYVSWHVLRGAAPWLSQPFVDANFKMRQALTGQKQIQDRWKRCVDLVDGSLGEALGQRYVEATFGADGKQRMLKMVDALEKSLDEDIQESLVDERRHQEAGEGEAAGDPQQDWISRRVARLQFGDDQAGRSDRAMWSGPMNSNRSGRSRRSTSRSTARNGA